MSAAASAPSAPSFFQRAMDQKRFLFGFSVTMLIIAFAIFAPLLAPYGENETAGAPYSTQGIFGTDYIGQDVLSRLMHGGQGVLLI
ncbi:MAG: ABC transporter permease, partial [Actinomycetota bacterium]|nr:ABC transporter permease [Actinomycetota bacterium]